MRMIKGKDTKPEMLVRKFLFAAGYRYKLHDKTLPGKPDIVLPKYNTVIFVHGCFWHGHKDCKYFVVPKTRTEWWTAKIEGNIERDNENKLELAKIGWHLITIFECQLRKSQIATTTHKLIKKIKI